MAQPDFTVEYLNPRDLKENPWQFRLHPDQQRTAVVQSIQEFGLVDGPLVNKRTGNLIDGHLRVEEAIKEGRETMPVKVVDLSEEQERRLLRMFDPLTALATEDNEALDRLIAEINDADLERLLGDLEEGGGSGLRPEADPDEVPESVPSRCQSGDLWALDHHRVLCGDAADAAVVERLMGQEEASLCFTSPPYDRQRDYGGDQRDWLSLMRGVFAHLPMAPEGQVLVNLGLVHRDGEWQPYWEPWIEWMREQGWRRFGWYVWDQGPGLPGDWNGRLAPSHEFIFHFNQMAEKARKTARCVGAEQGRINEGRGLRGTDGSVKAYTHIGRPVQDAKIPDSVFRVMRHKARGIEIKHPAVFPVALPAEIIEAFSDPGDGIYEPFAGSGTTLIACEQTGRSARCVELEPSYVDIILARWEQATNREAKLLARSA